MVVEMCAQGFQRLVTFFAENTVPFCGKCAVGVGIARFHDGALTATRDLSVVSLHLFTTANLPPDALLRKGWQRRKNNEGMAESDRGRVGFSADGLHNGKSNQKGSTRAVIVIVT